jgi:hypothetical protein
VNGDGPDDFAALDDMTLDELIAANVAVLKETQTMNGNLAAIMDKLDSATEQLSPMLDKLSGHPLFKMLGGK